MSRSVTTEHPNDIGAYLANWRYLINEMLQTRPKVRLPRAYDALADNTYDFALMLTYLDDKLSLLEKVEMNAEQLDSLA